MDEIDRGVFRAGVVGAYQRLEQRAQSAGWDEGLTTEALEELRTALEELQVANEALRAQTKELATAQALMDDERYRYRDLFTFAPEAYLVTDGAGVIHEANLEAAALLEIPADLVQGRPLALNVREEERHGFRIELLAIRNSTRTQQLTLRLQRRDGQQRVVSARVSRLPRHQAEPKLCWMLHDLTADQRLRAQLSQLEAQLAVTLQPGPAPLPVNGQVGNGQVAKGQVGSAQTLAGELAEARRRVDQLQRALDSRVVIEQAKGMLAGRWSCSPDEAFAVLRPYARSHNRRLYELAADVVAGRIPADLRPSRPDEGSPEGG